LECITKLLTKTTKRYNTDNDIIRYFKIKLSPEITEAIMLSAAVKASDVTL
jgi:hypothetical protein